MSPAGPLLIALFGIGLLGWGIVSYLRQSSNISRWIRVEGVVTGFVGRRMGPQTFVSAKTADGVRVERKTMFRPQVSFTIEDGRTVDLVGRVGSRPPRYNVGDTVGVLYNPQNPELACLDQFAELWFKTILLVLFGVLMVGMGALGWLLSGI